MFSYFKKPKLPTTALVMAGSLSFLVFGIITFILIIDSNYNNQARAYASDQIRIKNNLTLEDPMITKNPSLKEILAGPIISDRDPSLGNPGSPLTIVLFSDFTCAFCREQEAVLKKVTANYQDKVRIIWKDYPENNYASVSYQAAIAARCAFEQNKFWAYHDLLFQAGNILDTNMFSKAAQAVQLDMTIFQDCFGNGSTKKFINDNIIEANALDINGVPFIFINDQEVMGQASAADLENIIKLELSKQAK